MSNTNENTQRPVDTETQTAEHAAETIALQSAVTVPPTATVAEGPADQIGGIVAPDGAPLFPRDDLGLEANGAATIAVDLASEVPRVFRYNMASMSYVLDPTRTIDSDGNVTSAAAARQTPGTDSAPSSVLDLGNEGETPAGGRRGVTKTGGSTVNLNNDDFYDEVKEIDLKATLEKEPEKPFCVALEAHCPFAGNCLKEFILTAFGK